MSIFKKDAVKLSLSHSKQKHLKKIALLGCKAKIKLLAGKLDEGYTLIKKTAHNLRDFALELGQHISQPFASRWTLERFTDFEKQYSRKLGLPKKLLLGGVLVGMSALPALGQAFINAATTTDLVNAINTANGSVNDYVIRLEQNTVYTLTGNLPILTGTDIGGTLSIICTGTANAIIDGDDSFRPITIDPNADVTLSNLTIQNGFVTNAKGGGIYNNQGTLTISNSLITANEAAGSPNGRGGGLYNTGATVSIHNSTFSLNSANAFGGGICSYTGSTVTLHSSSIVGNTANQHGGGIVNIDNSKLILHSSSITGNASNGGAGGGGILNILNSTVTLHSSSITGNTAIRGGGVRNYNATFNSISSSITGNTATGEGGGIYQRAGTSDASATLTNTTISGNSATNGGGIFLNQQNISTTNTLNLTHVTLANNTAQTGNAGGLYLNRTNGMISFNPSNSILGGNSNADFDTNGAGSPNITITTAGQINLVENDISGRAIATHSCPPQLEPLQLVGGTQVHPLKNSSPAIDAGIATIVASDQRGVSHNVSPDLGAYEFGTGGLSCLCLSTPSDATIVWLGCVDSDWQNPTNWNTGNIPAINDHVYIPAGTPNELIIDEIATCSKFVQQIGAVVRVDFNAGGQLRVRIN